MKKLILLAVLLLPTVGWTQDATIVKKFPACVTEGWLDDMMAFARAGDDANFNMYLMAHRCFIPGLGMEVTIVKENWTKWQFAYKGSKFWAIRETFKR